MSSAAEPLPTSRLVPHPFGPWWLRAWMVRHQHPFNFWIHMIGIPLMILPLPLPLWDIFDPNLWLMAYGLIFLGVFLQFVGHLVEGNDMGEIILLKKALGLSYVGVAPRPAMAER